MYTGVNMCIYEYMPVYILHAWDDLSESVDPNLSEYK